MEKETILNKVIEVLKEHYNISYQEFTSPCRERELVDLRRIAATILHTKFNFTSTEVSDFLKKHRTSTNHLVSSHKSLLLTNKRYKTQFNFFEKELYSLLYSQEKQINLINHYYNLIEQYQRQLNNLRLKN